jgi:kynurenine formamidase
VSEVIDLTRPMTRETLIALGGKRVTDGWMVGEVQVEFLRSFAAGNNTEQCVWTIGDHLGTHVDAPVHVVEGAPAIDQVDLSRLVGEALVADCTRARGRGITPEDLEAAAHEVRAGDILLLYVDEPPGDIDHFIEHQTFVTVPAAHWIVEHAVTAVGVETACFEHAYQRTVVDRAYEPSEANPWPAHRVCLESDVYIIEGLTGLAPLAGQRVRFAAAPLPVPGSSGSPVRAFAWRS